MILSKSMLMGLLCLCLSQGALAESHKGESSPTKQTRSIAEKYSQLPKDFQAMLEGLFTNLDSPESFDELDLHKMAFKYAGNLSTHVGFAFDKYDAKAYADKILETFRGKPKEGRKYLIIHILAYNYAREKNKDFGLELGISDAKIFADQIAGDANASEKLVAHVHAYGYAHQSKNNAKPGLGKDAASSKIFADTIAARQDALNILAAHRKAYWYALEKLANGGLELTPSEAEIFASKQSRLNP